MQAEEKPLLEDCVGWGLDIVRIAKMERALSRTPRLCLRAFTEAEREYCERSNAPVVHYATRFAAKQAVLKALGMNTLSGIPLKDIEVLRVGKGRPSVRLHGKAAHAAKAKGVLEMPISLSFTHSEAVGCAMAVTADSVHAARKRVDPLRELSLQFKDARAMLDDLPVARASDAVASEAPAGSGIAHAGRPSGEARPEAALRSESDTAAPCGRKAAEGDDAAHKGEDGFDSLPGI